jgi:hypothetical protein
MSKTEILAELAQLSPEDLVEVRESLDRLLFKKAPPLELNKPRNSAPRLRSPRLAHPSQAGDFAKQITELPADATL